MRLLLKPSILVAAMLSLTALTACGQSRGRMIAPIKPVIVSVSAAEPAARGRRLRLFPLGLDQRAVLQKAHGLHLIV